MIKKVCFECCSNLITEARDREDNFQRGALFEPRCAVGWRRRSWRRALDFFKNPEAMVGNSKNKAENWWVQIKRKIVQHRYYFWLSKIFRGEENKNCVSFCVCVPSLESGGTKWVSGLLRRWRQFWPEHRITIQGDYWPFRIDDAYAPLLDRPPFFSDRFITHTFLPISFCSS